MRRPRSAAIIALTSALLSTGVFVPPAIAASPRNVVFISAKAHIKDDERRRDDIGDHTTERKLRLPDDNFFLWRPCQGGEVVAYTELVANPLYDGWIRVRWAVQLREGTSCHSLDVERHLVQIFDVKPGAEVKRSLRVETAERRSDDYALVEITVRNELVNAR
ncbi:hypothetical protein [Actinoplanes sp. NPDC049118]|uniref:hypothetical protein n=1 Tax=Actinoplanes sp. NPDC049118 TaxID=3155769 RepID=UPI0033C66191